MKKLLMAIAALALFTGCGGKHHPRKAFLIAAFKSLATVALSAGGYALGGWIYGHASAAVAWGMCTVGLTIVIAYNYAKSEHENKNNSRKS